MFKIYESPTEGACSRYTITRNHQVLRYMGYRNRQMRGACLRYMIKRKSKKREGVFMIYGEPEWPKESAFLRYRRKRRRF